MPVLTGVDVLDIQRYIFGSNRLRDVLAASWMVEHVTSLDALAQWGLTRGRILLAAGGNAVLQFDALDAADPTKAARNWTAAYTRWLQETAPGLEVAVAHHPYAANGLGRALQALQIKVAQRKLSRIPSAPQLGLSVTASCAITGLPAADLDQDIPVSRQIKQLRNRHQEAKDRWNPFRPVLPSPSPWTADFPIELDLMGRTHHHTSLVGVVHVDGNGVGRMIADWLQRQVDDGTNDETVWMKCGEWSRTLRDLGDTVLHALVVRVTGCLEEAGDHGNRYCALRGTPDELGFRLNDWHDDLLRRTTDDTVFLPLRPILLGGDDLTFVCDGRIALDLAVGALDEFGRHDIPHLGENGGTTRLTACAGVAMVKAHAPFHRSYELASGLCDSAKQARREANSPTSSWLDWHIGTTRPGETVATIRARQYGNGTLTMRPYPLPGSVARTQTWGWLDQELLGPGTGVAAGSNGFRGNDRWNESRNRVKQLGSLATDGKAEVQRQFRAWQASEHGVLAMPAALPDDGYLGSQTPLVDAIELIDLHLRLEMAPAVHSSAPVPAEDRSIPPGGEA